jgi:dTDP-glucose 4,6-dehydratase
MKKRLLLTGISGFIGSHIMDEVLVNTDWSIVGLASWQHKGIPKRILDSKYYQENKDRVEIMTHDLQAPLHESQIEQIGHIWYVINCASDSHVDRSITDPVGFILNNVKVALNVLELCRKLTAEKIIQISTDEVYGDAPEGEFHKEWSSIRPSNPYSASKAAQEAIAYSYWRTYSLPIMITNTMNNIGEKQDGEKYFPLLIRNALSGYQTKIHADGEKKKAGTRFYLHARNHANALVWILNNVEPQMYPTHTELTRLNIVGEKEVDNLTFAKMIYDIVKEYKHDIPPFNTLLVNFHSSRPGHDLRYALDGLKLSILGYAYPKSLEESMRKTIEWYLSHPEWLNIQ